VRTVERFSAAWVQVRVPVWWWRRVGPFWARVVGRRPLRGLGTAVGAMLILGSYGCSHGLKPTGQQPQSAASDPLLTWVEERLTPYLVAQLATHPRFQGEPFLLVGMHGADVQPEIDLLSADIRARLLDALLQRPGARPVWRPTVRPWRHHRRLEDVDCTGIASVHYYVGLDVQRLSGGEVAIRVRALDLGAGTWVNGFGLHWQGPATSEQLAALVQRRPDEYLRGLRVLPFNANQADLLAGYLARNLSCLLRQRQLDEVVLYVEPPAPSQAPFQTSLRLLRNYLGRFREVRVTERREQANVLARGEVHAIDGALYQVWVVTRFKAGGEHLSGTDTAAYVTIAPDASAPSVPVAAREPYGVSPAAPRLESFPAVAPGTRFVPILSSLRVLEPRFPNLCAARNPWAWGAQEWWPERASIAPPCFALELDVVREARVYLLRHNPNYRILRLLPASCRAGGTLYHQAQVGKTLRVPSLRGGRPALRSFDDGGDTVYAIAVHDPIVARRLEADLSRLPGLCGSSERPFGDPQTIDRWLARLNAFVVRHAGALDWRVVGTAPVRNSGVSVPTRIGRFSLAPAAEVR